MHTTRWKPIQDYTLDDCRYARKRGLWRSFADSLSGYLCSPLMTVCAWGMCVCAGYLLLVIVALL